MHFLTKKDPLSRLCSSSGGCASVILPRGHSQVSLYSAEGQETRVTIGEVWASQRAAQQCY